jgi:hypothetical protein
MGGERLNVRSRDREVVVVPITGGRKNRATPFGDIANGEDANPSHPRGAEGDVGVVAEFVEQAIDGHAGNYTGKSERRPGDRTAYRPL